MTAAERIADKTALRAQMRQVRAACAAADPHAAERAAAALPLERLPRAQVVSGYVAMGAELSPLPVLRRLAAAGARIALPVARDRQSPLSFRAWREGEPLTPDAFNIPSPGPEAEVLVPDLVIAPLLAFDLRGCRLGQGAGHYDQTLAALRGQGRVFVLGLAYAGQQISAAPMEPHDQPLDAVLTEAGLLDVNQDQDA